MTVPALLFDVSNIRRCNSWIGFTFVGDLLIRHVGVAFDGLTHRCSPDLLPSQTLHNQILLVCFVRVQLVKVAPHYNSPMGKAFW